MFFRRTYYDAEPIYIREQTPNWYQQLPATNEAIQRTLTDFPRGRDALEIGGGGGWLGRFLLQQGVQRYTGFDFSETAVHYAQKRIGKFKNADVYMGDALDPRSYRGTPDLVVAHQFVQCLIGDDPGGPAPDPPLRLARESAAQPLFRRRLGAACGN